MTDPKHAEAPDDPLIAAFFGSRPRHPLFHPEAALVPFWLAWRGFGIRQFGSYLVFGVIWLMLTVAFPDDSVLLPMVSTYVIISLLHGLAGGLLLEARARSERQRVLARGLEGDAALEAMRRAARPFWIGLAVYGSIGIALLAAILPPLMPHDHGAYVAAMKSDLRNLVTAEEIYFADSVTYTTSPTNLYFMSSAGVTVTIRAADNTGWSATAKHNGSDQVCGIWVGNASPPIRGSNEGEPKCERAEQHH